MNNNINFLRAAGIVVIILIGLFITGMAVYSLSKNQHNLKEHQEAVIITRQSLSLVQDSLVKEIKALNHINNALRSSISNTLYHSEKKQNEYLKQIKELNRAVKNLNARLAAVDTLSRSELEQRYNH